MSRLTRMHKGGGRREGQELMGVVGREALTKQNHQEGAADVVGDGACKDMRLLVDWIDGLISIFVSSSNILTQLARRAC